MKFVLGFIVAAILVAGDVYYLGFKPFEAIAFVFGCAAVAYAILLSDKLKQLSDNVDDKVGKIGEALGYKVDYKIKRLGDEVEKLSDKVGKLGEALGYKVEKIGDEIQALRLGRIG